MDRINARPAGAASDFDLDRLKAASRAFAVKSRAAGAASLEVPGAKAGPAGPITDLARAKLERLRSPTPRQQLKNFQVAIVAHDRAGRLQQDLRDRSDPVIQEERRQEASAGQEWRELMAAQSKQD